VLCKVCVALLNVPERLQTCPMKVKKGCMQNVRSSFHTAVTSMSVCVAANGSLT
jgi:hypothetical protein